MFKLEGMDVKDTARLASGNVKSRGKAYGSREDDQDGIQVVNWDQQALKSADGLSRNKDFRSAAVYAEVKLAEALNKRTLEKKLNGEDDTEGNPDMYRTAFCIHLLGELVGMSGPFGKVLSTIRDEVGKAIYSEYYAAQKEDLIFEQQTFFSALEHVEQEKEELLAEREQFRQLLEEREGEIDSIDKSIKDLTKSLSTAKQEKAGLEDNLKKVEKELGNRSAEFRLCVDDLKQARQTLIRTSDELKDMRSKNTEKAKKIHALAQEVTALRSQLDSVSKEKDKMQLASSETASKKELDHAKQTIEELESSILKLSSADTVHGARSLTPRPDWKKLQPFDPSGEMEMDQPSASPSKKGAKASDGTSTRSLAEQVVNRLKKSIGDLALAKKDVDVLRHQSRSAMNFLGPDPDPSDFAATVIEQLEAAGQEEERDNSKNVFRVLSDLKDEEKKKKEAAKTQQADSKKKEKEKEAVSTPSPKEWIIEPFGIDSNIPRFLRYTNPLKLIFFSRVETKQTIADIWSAKDEFDGLRTKATTLVEYIFVHLQEKYGNSMDMIAEEGYRLFLSCHCYEDDGEVRMFRMVMYGEISEESHFDFQCLVAGLMQEMQSKLESAEQTTIPRGEVSKVVDTFFPHMAKESTDNFKEALAREQGGKEAIDFMSLFDVEDLSEEDLSEKKRGAFLDAILLQYLRDLSEYGTQLKQELMKVKTDENGFAKLTDIRDIIVKCDERKTEDDILMYLTRGAHLTSVTDLKMYMDCGEEVEINEFVRNLQHKLVRASKYYVMNSLVGSGGDQQEDSNDGGGTFLTDGGDFSSAQPSLA